jgi:outer membrane lipoprotein-sorting protein
MRATLRRLAKNAGATIMLERTISRTTVRIAAIAGIGAAALALPMESRLAPIAPAYAQSDAAKLDLAVAALRGISTMRASFTQTDRNGNVSRGVMTLKRPGKIRFDYGKKADLLVVSNGKSLYLIDYEVKQVERWPIKNSPLGALLDPNRDVKKYGKLLPSGNANVVSVLVRDPNKPEFGTISMVFVKNSSAPGGWQLTNWVAKDAQNHLTTVRLSGHQYGVPVSESTFTFRDPRKSSRPSR